MDSHVLWFNLDTMLSLESKVLWVLIPSSPCPQIPREEPVPSESCSHSPC